MSDYRPSVLILEDDQQLGSVLKEALELKKYRVEWQSRPDRALQLFKAKKYDICLVDVGLPVMSGHDFVKEIRKSDYNTPILFMSANSSDSDLIHSYCAGGDDFIAKPFSTTELALRIFSLIKRAHPSKTNTQHPGLIQFGNYTLDYNNRLLCHEGNDISLTKKESEVLRMLAQNVNNVVKREMVLVDVWGENDYFMGRSMDVYIARLRKKLAEDESVSIVNVHKMGFKLEVKNQASA